MYFLANVGGAAKKLQSDDADSICRIVNRKISKIFFSRKDLFPAF